MLRKVTQRLAFVHAVLSLVLGIFVLGDVWPLAIVIALPLIAAAVVINEARKGTSRLRACIAVTAAGIIVFWLWITQQWPDGWIGFFVGLILAALELALWRKYVRLRRPFEKPSRKTVERGTVAIAIFAVLTGITSLILFAGRNANDQLAGPLTADIGSGQTVEVRYASFDEPLVGDGANIASVPVLNDGKGLVQSWSNFYDRTMALSPESRANVIANADRWSASTRQMYPDQSWMWFPSWSQIEDNLRFLTGEFRVIALVNVDMSDAEATRLIREKHPELPANLPVVRVKGALINSECGNGDCNKSPSPAKQFVDGNGQIRAMLTNPIQGKEGHWVTNITAAEHGVGLGTECWNGFLGSRPLSEEVKQTLTSKAATGNGSTTVVTTTAVITSTTVTPSSSTTTKVTTTTPTGSTTTVTTTTPTSTTTTVTTTTPTRTTTNTTTTNTTTNTTTTNTTTSTTPSSTSKNPEADPENQGNNNPGHGGNNDTPDPTPSDPAGGLPPSSYTAPATPEPTTTVRPTEAIPSNQGQPSNEPVPADPTDDTPPCDPEICGGPGVIQDTNPSPHTAEAAPSSEAPVAVEEEAAPPAATHSESAPAVTQPSQQSQAPVAPSPASQERVSTSSVSAGDIDNTASSQETGNDSGIILIAIIGTGGLGVIAGSALYRRRHPREKMAHKA